MDSDGESRVPPILPPLAFNLLKDAEQTYRKDSKYEILQSLHSVFGSVFVRATELLENGQFLQYVTQSSFRRVLKVISRTEQYTVFPDINFCHCHAFKYQVLHARNAITCKHVLAVKLAEIGGAAKVEVITDAQLVDILNDQLEHLEQ